MRLRHTLAVSAGQADCLRFAAGAVLTIPDLFVAEAQFFGHFGADRFAGRRDRRSFAFLARLHRSSLSMRFYLLHSGVRHSEIVIIGHGSKPGNNHVCVCGVSVHCGPVAPFCCRKGL